MTKFHIAIITGTRAEFGIWRPVLAAINTSKSLHADLFVTGMHLLPKFGNTIRDIQASGQKIAARIPMYRGTEPPAASLARAITGFAKSFRQFKPDLVFLLGDRLEMLAAANAALACRIPIAHLHGGESARGIWDEQIRHAISKMAHLHFCATRRSRWRLLKMGEPPSTIYDLGAPALDAAVEHEILTRDVAKKLRRYRHAGKIPHEALLILHPEGGTNTEEKQKTEMLLRSLQAAHIQIRAIGPNNDPGYEGILQACQAANIKVEMSLPQDQFWTHLAHASFLIGNSSSGIIEAASFGIPVINIGNRQAGRDRNPNILDIGWKRNAIAAAIKKATTDKPFLRRIAHRDNIYGRGNAAAQIAKILERLARTGITLEKQFWN